MDNEQDVPEVLETPEAEAEQPQEAAEEELTKEQIAELKAKAAKAEELESKNKQLYERAKKAEAEKQKADAPKQEGLSEKDLIYIATAGIHTDDIDEVRDYAKLRGISVAQAHEYMKPILEHRSEERRTAAATQTKGSPRGAMKATGSDLLTKAEKTGEVPETDDGMRAVAEARLARKKQH